MAYNPFGNSGMEGRLDRKRRDERIASNRERAEKVPHVEIDPNILRIAGVLEQKRHENGIAIEDVYFDDFSEESRRADGAYVESMKERFRSNTLQEQQLHQLGSAFEYIVAHRINESEWLGKNIKAQLTSEYDDLRNGIDLYIEDTSMDSDDRKPVGLSVDVTFSKDEKQLRGKFENLKNFSLNRGALAHLKYYKPVSASNESPTTPKELKEFISLPKVIVGVSKESVYKVLTNFHKGVDPKTADPAIGLIILRQMELQLAAFEEYSRKKFSKSELPQLESAAEAYRDAHESVKELLNTRMTLFKNMDRSWIDTQMAKEPVSLALQKILEEIMREVEK